MMTPKIGGAVALATILLTSNAFAAPLTVQDTLGTFNLVTMNYTGTQEVEGRTYIGSDITGVTGQFGFATPADGSAFHELYIDGNINSSTINLAVGDTAVISGTTTGGSAVNNGTLIKDDTLLPEVDFAVYEAESAGLAALSGTNADLSDFNNKVFGAPSTENYSVMDVDISDLSGGGYSFDFDGGALDYIIINVSGLTGTFGMNPLGSTVNMASMVIWNFYEATNIQVNSVIAGHVLAPYATMSGFAGSTEGTVIARTVNLTNGELHQQSWDKQLPGGGGGVSDVPLPAGLPLLAAGLVVLGLRRRKN